MNEAVKKELDLAEYHMQEVVDGTTSHGADELVGQLLDAVKRLHRAVHLLAEDQSQV